MTNICECHSWCAAEGSNSLGRHHHKNCKKYGEQKYPCLFYYCDGVDAWVPASHRTLNTVDPCNFSDGEEWEVRFKRIDMTDEEFDNLPED